MEQMKALKKSLCALILLTAVLLNRAAAQDSLHYTRDGVRLPVVNTGNNTLVELYRADSTFDFTVATASFPAGKKLAWHYHPGGQILIITEGTCYYQERGKPVQVVRKGEVIRCLPGVQHWHGASLNESGTYLAVSPAQKGATVWLEQVTDEDYHSVKK